MKKLALVLAVLMLLFCIGCESGGVPEESTTGTSTETSASDDEAMGTDELFNLYLILYNKIYAADSGLNDGITVIAVDFSGIENLTADEKDGLISKISKNGCVLRSATSEQLIAEGLIDEYGNFTSGILISIIAKTTGENTVLFSVSKFRSSLGAVGYSSSTAVFENGKWTISYGSVWIS